ncbi:MFS transporter [Streptomyces sp. NPDC057746]|uniref:MFS transporter n=1 Tax=Streptomyces sp. NPDC057746 TaxID=3346237 RepID=UPI00367F06BD
MPLALLALAIGAFGLGTTEFIPTGLLPQIATDFHISIPTAGLLVTVYALGVVFGSPLMTALGTKMSRKRILLLLMALFVLGNLLSALAPDFGLMLAGRVVTSLAHGAYFGIGVVLATELVAPEKKANAIAITLTGLTVANVVGVPLGTYIGQAAGWRVTFTLVAALGVIALLALAKFVPAMPRPENVHLRHEIAALRNPQVPLAMAITVLGFGGVFAAITYIAPMMTWVAGFSEGSLTWLLILLGIGMVIGNLASGRLADRALMPMLYVALGGLAVVLALFTFTAHNKILAAITIMLVGAFGFATVPPLNKRVLDQAHGAPTLASALNVGAFNLGNALSAWLGGLVISAGFGYTAPNWVGALMAAAALGLALWSTALERRGRRTAVTADPGPAPSQLTKR